MCEPYQRFYVTTLQDIPHNITLKDLKLHILCDLPVIGKLYKNGTAKIIFWHQKDADAFLRMGNLLCCGKKLKIQQYEKDLHRTNSAMADPVQSADLKKQPPIEDMFIPMTLGKVRLLSNALSAFHPIAQRNIQFHNDGVSIRGSKEELVAVQTTLSSILEITYKIDRPGDAVFCTTTNGQEFLHNLEEQCDVSIEFLLDITPYTYTRTDSTYSYKIDVVQGDLLSQNCEAIVTSAGTNGKPLSQLSRAVFDRSGMTFLEEYHEIIKFSEPMEVIVMNPGKLGCRHLMVCVTNGVINPQNLSRMMENLLVQCGQHNISSVAMPVLFAGVTSYSFKTEQAVQIIHQELSHWKKDGTNKFPNEIRLVEYDQERADEYRKAVMHSTTGQPQASAYENTNTRSDIRVYGDTLLMQCGLRIQLVKGTIADETTDVIVNSISQHLNLDSGMVSKSLLQKAGKELQKHFEAKARETLKPDSQGEVTLLPGDIIVSNSGLLQCKRVYHVHCGYWKVNTDSKAYSSLIGDCLLKAHNAGYTSIAFPAIGTGKLKVPDETVAKLMQLEAIAFGTKYPATPLKTVRFVIYPGNTELVKAFEQEVRKWDQHRDIKDKMDITCTGKLNDLRVELNNKMTIHIIEGSSLDVDIIVQSVQKGKSEVLLQYNTKAKVLELNTTILFSISDWKKAIYACLREVDIFGHRSVAFEIIWEGANIMVGDIADIFMDACAEFSIRPEHRICNIDIHNANPDLRDAFANMVHPRENKSKIQYARELGTRMLSKLGVTSVWQPEEVTSENIEPAIKVSEKIDSKFELRTILWDSILLHPIYDIFKGMSLQIYGFDQAKITKVKQELDHVLNTTNLMYQNISTNSKQEVSGISSGALKSVSKTNHPPSKTTATSNIVASKRRERVMAPDNAPKQVASKPRERVMAPDNASKQVRKRVMVDEPKTIVGGDFSDTNNSENTGNLTMISNTERGVNKQAKYATDTHVECSDTGTIRCDTVEDKPLSDSGIAITILGISEDEQGRSLDIIGDPSLVKTEILSQNSKEFAEINTRFMEGTKDDFSIIQIVKIHNSGFRLRVKLHEMYMRKKNKNKSVAQMLWHGSKRELIDTIVTNGFNRSYSGQNATFFGQGVYFARDVEYACRDRYSQPDASGFKYVYYCEVMTGKYTLGTKNITDAPAKDKEIPHILYDSTVNDIKDPKVFVVFKDTQAYPKYLIKLR